MKIGLLYSSCLTVLGLLFSLEVHAQLLGSEETMSKTYSADSFPGERRIEKINYSAPAQKPAAWNPQTRSSVDRNTSKPDTALSSKNNTNTNKSQTSVASGTKKSIPTDVQPLKITNKGIDFENEESIFLYYTNFKINHIVGGTVSCDVRFVLLTALSDKLSNISMRLKWPKMETTLTFDDVEPGVQTYYDYRLYGDGCYSMDKLPNVIINRCRLKGHTQRECASLLKLMKFYENK